MRRHGKRYQRGQKPNGQKQTTRLFGSGGIFVA
jgi:hypothetical protein